jgi:hypothetical protein
MIKIKAISDCLSNIPNFLSFNKDQLFYVLSFHDHNVYYVSTSCILPFSKNSTSGFVFGSHFIIEKCSI